jgi:hypothetical protein
MPIVYFFSISFISYYRTQSCCVSSPPADTLFHLLLHHPHPHPLLSLQVYFGKICNAAQLNTYSPAEYSTVNLLDRTFSWTVDLSELGCSCGASLFLVPMAQQTTPNSRGDYYCDIDDAGSQCAELDLMIANKHAFHLSLHATTDTDSNDGGGVDGGYGGGTDSHDYGAGVTTDVSWNGPRDFDSSEYGPGASCVDTDRPFRVQAVFPVSAATGDLEFVKAVLTQDGCSLHTSKVGLNFATSELTSVLRDGVMPVVETFASGNNDMRWLSSAGLDGLGPCTEAMNEASKAVGCGKSTFTAFALGDANDVVGDGGGDGTDDDDDDSNNQDLPNGGKSFCCFQASAGFADACLGCGNMADEGNWCHGIDRCKQCAGATWCEGAPTHMPTLLPPTPNPTTATPFPTATPTHTPTKKPSPQPSVTPKPTARPTTPPTREPTHTPTHHPIPRPTAQPAVGYGNDGDNAAGRNSSANNDGSGGNNNGQQHNTISTASASLLVMGSVMVVIVLGVLGMVWHRELKKEAWRQDVRKRTAQQKQIQENKRLERRRRRRQEEGRGDDDDEDDDEDDEDDEDDNDGDGSISGVGAGSGPAAGAGVGVPSSHKTAGTKAVVNRGKGVGKADAEDDGEDKDMTLFESLERALFTPWRWQPPPSMRRLTIEELNRKEEARARKEKNAVLDSQVGKKRKMAVEKKKRVSLREWEGGVGGVCVWCVLGESWWKVKQREESLIPHLERVEIAGVFFFPPC